MKELPGRIILKIKWIFRKKISTPPMHIKRKVIEHYRKIYEPKVMLETGTFFGDTVEYFKNKFESIISIELSSDLATKAIERFRADSNIRIIQGDSSDVLPSLLIDLKVPVLFWLDGHYSSEFFIGDEFIRTAKGDLNTPIEKELDIILRSKIESIILIDDARLFNGKDDYPTLNAIIEKVKGYKDNATVLLEKDIIVIIPESNKKVTTNVK